MIRMQSFMRLLTSASSGPAKLQIYSTISAGSRVWCLSALYMVLNSQRFISNGDSGGSPSARRQPRLHVHVRWHCVDCLVRDRVRQVYRGERRVLPAEEAR